MSADYSALPRPGSEACARMDDMLRGRDETAVFFQQIYTAFYARSWRRVATWMDYAYTPTRRAGVKRAFAMLTAELGKGGELVQGLDLSDPTDCLLAAELANMLAKEAASAFFRFKPFWVVEALLHGAQGGWKRDELGHAVFNLYTPEGGCTGFHDPEEDLRRALPDAWNRTTWPHAWCRLPRQPVIMQLLASRLGQPGWEYLLPAMAAATAPGQVWSKAPPFLQDLLHRSQKRYRRY